jgi:hypothetical protein
LGLGPEELLAQQPRLIYVSISGVGETGHMPRNGSMIRSCRACRGSQIFKRNR